MGLVFENAQEILIFQNADSTSPKAADDIDISNHMKED